MPDETAPPEPERSGRGFERISRAELERAARRIEGWAALAARLAVRAVDAPELPPE